MAYTYTVSYSTSATGPWTQFGSPVTTTTDVVTGLAASTAYFIQIITTDVATGLVSAPSVTGPYTTSAVVGPTESPQGTAIFDATGTIFASQTIGQAPAAGATLDRWQLTGAGGQAILNGTTRSDTASVTELWYGFHKLYQTSPNGNSLGTPGWWQWNGTGWTDVTNPIPPGPTISINAIASQSVNQPFNVSGTLTNYTSPPTLQYQDGSGPFTNLPTQPATTTSFSFTHPGFTAGSTGMTITVRDATTTTISATSNSFTVVNPASVTLTGIALSSTSVQAGQAGATVGTITVNTTGGAYTGQNTIDPGGDAASFSISGNTTLQTAVALTAAGSPYHITLRATMPGATGSPLTAAETITALSGPAVGPGVTSSFMTFDFTSLTGATLPASLFGICISSQSDASRGGAFKSSGITDPQVVSTFRSLQGSVPGTFLRWNLENNGQNGDGSVNTFYVDQVTQWTQQLIDPSVSTFSYNVGNTGASPSQNGVGAGQVYDRFVANGLQCLQYEVFNEVDTVGLDYNAHFVQMSTVLHQRNPNCVVIGNNFASMNGGALQSLASASGSGIARCDRFQWHNYQAGPNQGSWPMFQATGTFGGRDVSGCRGAINNGGRGSAPQGCGEYNMDGNDQQPLQYQVGGAIYNNLAMWSSFTTDNNFTHGLLWQAFADGGFGQIVDTVMASSKGLQYLSMVPCGHVLAMCRRFLPGKVARTINQSAGANGNIATLATVNGSKFAVWIINFDQFAASTAGTVALSHWPVNSTGNGTIQRWEVSQAHQTAFQSSLGVSGGMTGQITLPAASVTILTSG